MEQLIQILFQGANELAVFYTYMSMILRRALPESVAYSKCLQFCATLAQRLNEDSTAPFEEFNKFFLNHLFRNYCSIIKEFPNKRDHICRLIFWHTLHDLNLRIKVVQNLKKHIKEDEIVYQCQANLIALEETFNEQWFDVFLYYALIGLSNPKSSIRVYSLSILNTIGKHNAESIMDVTEKVLMMSRDPHWEVKTQCLIFAVTILSNFREMSHLLVVKQDDMKGGIQKTMSGKPGSA